MLIAVKQQECCFSRIVLKHKETKNSAFGRRQFNMGGLSVKYVKDIKQQLIKS
jgi:hypothetical protein